MNVSYYLGKSKGKLIASVILYWKKADILIKRILP